MIEASNWFVSTDGDDVKGCGTTRAHTCRSVRYASLAMHETDTLHVDGSVHDVKYEICNEPVNTSEEGVSMGVSKGVTEGVADEVGDNRRNQLVIQKVRVMRTS